MAPLDATEGDFPGHTISLAGVNVDAAKVAVLNDIPMAKDIQQLRSLLEEISYYRKLLPRNASAPSRLF